MSISFIPISTTCIYRGSSTHPALRFLQHNNGLAEYTKKFTPWVLVYLEKYSAKSDALKREGSLKKNQKKSFPLAHLMFRIVF